MKFYKKSLIFHKKPTPGKISIKLKKKINDINDLSLAYSPGVANVCKEIKKKKKNSFKYTSRGNLVAVITNGTAVLGLGDIGPLASKPVMEGKSILFKKFAGIDSFDIEIKEKNPNKLVNIIKSLENTFGGINLEDIKSPDCFYIENKCKKKMKIPVFHDDQHGTAVVVLAALKNALNIVKKKINKIKTVVFGAGAAAIACLNLLISEGLNIKKTFVFDLKGILNNKRKDIDKFRKKFVKNKKYTIKEVLKNSDFILGLSTEKVIKGKFLKKMNKNPIIFVLANPNPEIFPEEIKKYRGDAIIATGRSDYPNQVNNVLCFPYIFRAALDYKIKKINNYIKKITAYSLSKLGRKSKDFSKKKLLPNIFNRKLITTIPYDIAKGFCKKKKKKFNKKYYFFLKNILND
ncbi:malic enzyme-like NAD(P)-binding protein [Candidatus Vidania fulgoroideorum]